MRLERYVLIFFMDGVGMGTAVPENPFTHAELPTLSGLFGENWFLAENGSISSATATLVPTDAGLGMPGRPQSATGQATILSGRNVPQQIGEHYGPKPNAPVREAIGKGTLFDEVLAMGGKAALLSPYPPPYFAAIESGKRLFSAVPLAANNAGVLLRGVDELRAGQAVSPDFTASGWRTHLGYPDMPLLTPAAAGVQLAANAADYNFSFFEHWPSDRAGHRGTLETAVTHLELIDNALGGLLAAWPSQNGLLIITSDHGNIEDKSHRKHTENPVPTILVGEGHAELATLIHDLTDIATVTRRFLGLPAKN